MAEMMTIAEAAELLGISEAGMYRLCARGAIDHYRPMPRAIRLRRRDVDAYLESTLRRGVDDEAGGLTEVVMPRRGGWGR